MTLSFARITARYAVTGPDGPDTDRYLEEVPIPGLEITFTPPADTIVRTSVGTKSETLITAQTGITDAYGVLCTNDLGSGTLIPDLYLTILPDGVAYTVTIASDYWPAQEFQILLSADQVLDLSDRVLISADPSGAISEWQSVVVQALAAKAAAETAATAAAASAASVSRNTANGVAPLDGTTRVPDANMPVRLSASSLASTFVPRWQPTTAYAINAMVISPLGDLVSAISAFTSASTFVPANWAFSTAIAGKLSSETAEATYATKTATTASLKDYGGQSLLVSGRYMAASGATSVVPLPLTNETMYAVPIVFRNAGTLDSIGIQVGAVGNAGSKLRLGIYSDNGTGVYPGARLLDAGQVAADVTGAAVITISQAVTAGAYWLVCVAQSAATTAPSVPCPLVLSSRIMPTSLAAAAAGDGRSYQQTGVTGTLPATFTTSIATGIRDPRVVVRAL